MAQETFGIILKNQTAIGVLVSAIIWDALNSVNIIFTFDKQCGNETKTTVQTTCLFSSM